MGALSRHICRNDLDVLDGVLCDAQLPRGLPGMHVQLDVVRGPLGLGYLALPGPSGSKSSLTWWLITRAWGTLKEFPLSMSFRMSGHAAVG